MTGRRYARRARLRSIVWRTSSRRHLARRGWVRGLRRRRMAREDPLTARRVAGPGRVERTRDLDAAQIGSRSCFRDVDAGRIRPQERQARRLRDRGRLLHEGDLHVMRTCLHRHTYLPLAIGPVPLRLALSVPRGRAPPPRAPAASAALTSTCGTARCRGSSVRLDWIVCRHVGLPPPAPTVEAAAARRRQAA